MSEFKVGDWVKTQGHRGLMIIYKVTGEKAIVDVISRTGKSIGLSGYKLSEIEHASEAEIKAGHRIDDCSGCNGRGEVGNVLDGGTCPCCKGSGVELETLDKPENHISQLCKVEDV